EAGESRAKAESLSAELRRVETDLAAIEKEADALREAHEGAQREVLELLHKASKARNEETERRTEARQAEARLARLADQRSELADRLSRAEAEAQALAAAAATMDAETERVGASLAAAEE